MNFYQKRRRTPVLQIISMIDILIILLIFLVVSTTFKERRKKTSTAAAPERSVLNVSIPVSESLNLGTDTTERVSLTVTKDGNFYLADAAVPAADLQAAVTRFREVSTAAKLDLRIDENVSFGTIIKVWDALTKAGFKVGEVPARVLRKGA
jgi:biopolymer transport protein ExbD